ncbi:MAG: hypothetical protein M1830_005931 [Pleopsidium flavum]|nr:MAG: hypothetical protein M1830_005931 [Pleopsidium flavum]
MQVKDYLQALSDGGKICVEKIGSGNWYWSFAGKEKKKKTDVLDELKVKKARVEKSIRELREKIVAAGKYYGISPTIRLYTSRSPRVQLCSSMLAFALSPPPGRRASPCTFIIRVVRYDRNDALSDEDPLAWTASTPHAVKVNRSTESGQQLLLDPVAACKSRSIHGYGPILTSVEHRGKAIAIRLAEDGFDVCINDVQANSNGVDEVVKQIEGLGRKAIGVVADVTSLKEVEGMIQKSVDNLGPLDVMVANAGIAQVKGLLDLTEEDVRRMFDVNFFGVFNCYSSAARQFIKQKTPGKIIGAASIVAFKPFALLSHYSASKWAVRGLTQAFAMEMAPHKITVNGYAPGIVGTAMWDEIDEKLGEMQGVAKGESIKKYSSVIALGRTSVPEDVSKTVSFLAGPDSDYMTGQTLIIDGGIIFN